MSTTNFIDVVSILEECICSRLPPPTLLSLPLNT